MTTMTTDTASPPEPPTLSFHGISFRLVVSCVVTFVMGMVVSAPAYKEHAKTGTATSSSALLLEPQVTSTIRHAHIPAKDVSNRLEAINYLRQPDAFVKVFRDCVADDACHITYHHVSKTGGTTVEEAFFPLFGQDIEHSCCHSKMISKFDADVDTYCNQKFTSWQVNENELWHIVRTCQERQWSHNNNSTNNNNNQTLTSRRRRRTVVMTTYREPIATFLSLVHQMCNKNLGKRSPRQTSACKACNYETGTDVWLDYVKTVERQITGAYNVSHWLQKEHGRHTLSAVDTTIVTIEANDLDTFWHTFQPNRTLTHRNPQDLSKCSFRPTAELLVALRPAENVYRRMVAGRDFA